MTEAAAIGTMEQAQDFLPMAPRQRPQPAADAPPLWLTLLARWAAAEVRTPRASARD